MSKDQWFALFERKLFELEDEGYPSDEEKDLAADYADMRRQQKKEEGF